MLKTGFGRKWEEWSIIFFGEKNWPSIADQFNLKVVNKGKKMESGGTSLNIIKILKMERNETNP